MLENRDFEKMEKYSIDSVVVDLTDWYGRHPTGAIAYSSDLCVCSDYCDSVEDYEEFFDLIKDNLNINVRITVNMDMDALGDAVPFAEKVKEAFDRVKRRTEHRYGMRNRGFSPGCQPMEGLIECIHDITPENGRTYYDKLVYGRQLTDKELEAYEIDYLGPMPEGEEL